MRTLLVASTLLLAALVVPSAAAEATDADADAVDLAQCIIEGQWYYLVQRAPACYDECVGSGHWTTFPSRVAACLL